MGWKKKRNFFSMVQIRAISNDFKTFEFLLKKSSSNFLAFYKPILPIKMIPYSNILVWNSNINKMHVSHFHEKIGQNSRLLEKFHKLSNLISF